MDYYITLNLVQLWLRNVILDGKNNQTSTKVLKLVVREPLLYKICHKVEHLLQEYLHHFVAARNTRDLAAVGELALVI